MPLIKTYEKDEATGELEELYKKIIEIRGDVSNAHKLFSTSPELLKQQLSFIKYYFNHKSFTQDFLASMRILVSSDVKCDFCVDFNSAMLINKMGWSLDEVSQLKSDYKNSRLSDREKSLMEFVLKSLKEPHSIGLVDVDTLKAMDWSDSDILDATNHGARMVAIDTLFNTFKIEPFA